MKKFKVTVTVEAPQGGGVSAWAQITVPNSEETKDVLATLKRVIEAYPGCIR